MNGNHEISRLSVVDIAQRLNIPNMERQGDDYVAPCPIHGEQRGKSLRLYGGQGKGWYCFGACAKGGDAAALVMSVRGCDFKTACAWLGIEVRGVLSPVTVLPPKLAPKPASSAMLEAGRRYRDTLLNTPALLDKLRTERGLTEATVRLYGLGYIPPRSWSKAQHDANEQYAAWSIPVHDRDGKVLLVKGRLWNVSGVGKYMPWEAGHGAPLNWCMVDPSENALGIVAGDFDALALAQLGINAVSVPGQGNFRAEYVEQFAGFTRIFVLFDPGEEANARKVASMLTGGAREIMLCSLAGSGYHDASEFVARGGDMATLADIWQAKRYEHEAAVMSDEDYMWQDSEPVEQPELESDVAHKVFVWYSRRDLKKLPRQTWLIDGYLVSNTLAVVYGPPGSGKSFLAVDYACKLAQAHQAVVYVAAEGAEGIGPRITAWERLHNEGDELINLIVIPETANMMSQEDSTALVDTIRAAIEAQAATNDSAVGLPAMPTLIVIDTLARSMPGGNENQQEDVALLIHHCEQVRQLTGGTVLLVHHANKGGSSSRGSTVIPASAETIIALTTNADKTLITLKIEKQKNHKEMPEASFRLQDDTWTEQDWQTGADVEMSSCVFIEADNVPLVSGLTNQQIAVMRVLASPSLGPVVSLAKLAENTGMSTGGVSNKLDALMRHQPAFVAKAGRGMYSLTDEGRKWLEYIEDQS